MNNNDYLKTPEHFKMLVESKVNEQLNTPISDKKNRQHPYRRKKKNPDTILKKSQLRLLSSPLLPRLRFLQLNISDLATILKAAQKHTTKAIWKPLITATYLSKTVFLNK